MILNVCRTFTFDAAHQLPNYDGLCANLHGHQWTLEVEVSGAKDNTTGMVMDFKQMKEIVNEAIIRIFDHHFINDFIANPTAENIVEWTVFVLSADFADYNLRLARIRLYETPNSFCEWKRTE